MVDRSSASSATKPLYLDENIRLTISQSIARAVYSRKKLAIFDDVLSGLDSVTEEPVFQRVFGRNGLLRRIGATAILATHSGKVGRVSSSYIC